MKKHLKKILSICFLIFAIACLFGVNQQVVFATDETNDLYGGYIVGTKYITDEYLYSALLKVAGDQADKLGVSYNSDSIYSGTFKNTKEITIHNKNITSLAGLERLDLENLEVLTLTNNDISSIDVAVFKAMPNLKVLNLSDNNITKINLNDCENLNNVNLSNNELTEIVIDEIISESLTLNLSNNNITDMANIKLPLSIENIDLNIFSNEISDINSDYWQMSNLNIGAGLQGFKDDKVEYSFSKKDNIKIYNIGNDRLSIKIYKTGESTPYRTIKSSDITEGVLNVNLPIGEYNFVYALDGVDINPKLNKDYAYLVANSFSILPTPGTHKFEFKGKTYDTLGKVTGVVKVIMSCEEGGTIYYSINGSKWQEGNVAVCDNGGNYSVSYKVVQDGFESEEVSVFIKTSLNTVISDGLMLAITLFLALVLFLVVMPFISKKFFHKK